MDRLDKAREILQNEADAVLGMAQKLGPSFSRVVGRILDCDGQVVVTGIGKPYFVAQKFSASLASTGTPSIALHPVDALHGDLGRLSGRDMVFALSNSGSSEEILRLVQVIKEMGIFLVAVTGDGDSALAGESDEVLLIGRIQEPCPLGLAPASSTTAMLALGDAITLVVAEERGLKPEDYARLHPGGIIGRKLRTVRQAMRMLDKTAVVKQDVSLVRVLNEITSARSGAAFIVDENGVLLGIFTDGDLRRVISSNNSAIMENVGKYMTRNPKTVLPDRSVSEAVQLLRTYKVDELPVIDSAGVLVGHLDVQDVIEDG
ncbi:MAG: KpsF/GutQ family sugar-phosphate isomerase [Deltaproteobacteria bacterium]|nr:KpsF/GutQ family sugar-phosphate isomerase [Deltaproteobacteria bacterium]